MRATLLEISTMTTIEILTHLYHSLNREVIGCQAKLEELEDDRSLNYSEWFQTATDMEIEKTQKQLVLLNQQMAEIHDLLIKEVGEL